MHVQLMRLYSLILMMKKYVALYKSFITDDVSGIIIYQ